MTLNDLQKEVNTFTIDERRQLAEFLAALRVKEPPESGGHKVMSDGGQTGKPWMELAGCFAHESDELRRIEQVVEREFEQIDPEHWR